MGRHSITSHSARRALGVAGIVGFVALALCCDANVLTSLHIMNKVKAEESLVGGLRGKSHPSLGGEGAPTLSGRQAKRSNRRPNLRNRVSRS